ncbi:MAG: 4Fe-4S binding protein [Planctomycetota bacterium]|nr:MAG: 4Fe-4S binding protein [Planctomycetota bacterium]
MRFTGCGGSKLQEDGAAAFELISSGTRLFLIFSYGLFSISAQTLLFREFITSLEGSDISVGIFFGSWFLWVGLGAVLIYRAKALAKFFLKNIEFLLLAYLPAFILELILIIQVRELAGIESYALLPVRAILLLSIVVNAPVSIITGMFFPIACRWFQQEQELPVSRVYIIEAAGSFIGGLGVTVLLGFGVSLMRVFFILALIVSLAAFAVQFAKARRYAKLKIRTQLMSLIPLCALLCMVFGADKALMGYVRVIKWSKLLAADALTGSFQTAQAEYLYGVYHGQWIAIREGSVCESLPDESTTGRIAAIGLCQNPDAKRVLIVGSGLGLCYQFLRLPQVEHVTWAHSDNEYVQKVGGFISPELKVSDERFYGLTTDVRSLLAKQKQYYDLVIINLPDATSSVLNRYYTLEFYQQVKEALRGDGVLAVRVAGGENIMGTELINLGASTKLTLEKIFTQLALTPGEDTWFIASDSERLTGEPGSLRDRFAAIKGGGKIFPAEGLLSVYLPDRAASAMEGYSGADLPEALLINRDRRPLTHLYSLLLAAKQSGAPITRIVKLLAVAGPLAFIIPIVVLMALRVVYTLRAAQQVRSEVCAGNGANTLSSLSSFESTFLVFSTGLAGIGVVIVLMYLYQTHFGSLYLHIGVVSSLFMAGLTAGAILIRHLLVRKRKVRAEILLFAVIAVHTLILGTIAFWPGVQPTHLTFAVGFVLCGFCAGCYWPLAARQLADCGFETGRTGSKLEMADHLGASIGGLVTGLALVPVLGSRLTLFVFVLLILANVPLAALRRYKPEKVRSLAKISFELRRLGYILFGVGISVILCSNLLAKAGARLRPSLPQYAAQALAGELRLERVSTAVDDGAREISYFSVYKLVEAAPEETVKESLTGYILSSEEFAPEVRGFGGRMNLAIYVDPSGRLTDFHIIRSNETPAYLELLSEWRKQLKGRGLFQPRSLADVDAVTGATVSSKAVLSALEFSGRRFTGQVLGQAYPEYESTREQEAKSAYDYLAKYLPDSHGIYLISAFALTFLVIYRGGFWSRLAILCFNFVVGGLILNAQYSSEQMATILSLDGPAAGLSGAFLLVVVVPLLVIIFGNIYCGYLCPFGALQELLGYVVPRRFKQPIPAGKVGKARFVKYVVLFVFIMVFFVSRDRTTLAADPLISIFNLQLSVSGFQLAIANWQFSMLLIVAVALIGSIFYTRFWCRYLCPVGAFLSLLNSVVVLKRFLPAKRFGRCEFGLTPKDKMDCLYCDKCRYEGYKVTEELRPLVPLKGLSRYFVVGVLVVALFVSAVSVNRFFHVVPTGFVQPVISASAAGQPRDVNLQRIRTMIQQKRLSEQEAEFYKKVD